MKLTECVAGDVVAIVWPMNDYDQQLAGTEQIVQLGSLLGGKKSKKDKPHTAIVVIYDRETLAPRRGSNTRAIRPDIEVIELVERSPHARSDDDGTERHAGDISDPLQGGGR